jgi:hypothetical protein
MSKVVPTKMFVLMAVQEMRFVEACVIKAWLAVPLILNRMDPSNPRWIESGSTTGKFVVPKTRMFIGSEIPTCFPLLATLAVSV